MQWTQPLVRPHRHWPHPATVDTSIGRLEFKDGVPSEATAQKLYDQLDLQRGVDAFMNGLRGVSIPAAVAEADGTTTVYFAPRRPDGIADGNWIKTVPGKGWFVILRPYSPLENFFTKEWRPGDIEIVTRDARTVPTSDMTP